MATTRKKVFILILCIAAPAIAFSPAVIWAQEDQELEEILEGFDDAQNGEAEEKDETTSDLSEEEILEGFDEESTASAPVEKRYGRSSGTSR